LLFRVAYTWRESIAAGLLLSARLSLIIAASAVGLKLGVITDAVNSAVILIALVTCTLSPLLFKVLAPAPRKPKDRILLVGCRHATEVLAERLQQHGLNPSAVCSNDDLRRPQVESGVPSLQFRDRIKAELKQAGIEAAKVLVVLEERDEDGLLVCRMARKLFGVRNIIAWIQEPHNKDYFRRLGARVVNPALSTSLLIEGMILSPAVFELAADIDEIEIRQFKLKSNRAVGCRVDELQLPDGVSVMSIQRGGATLVPENGTLLRENDTLTLVGSLQGLKKSMRILHSAGN